MRLSYERSAVQLLKNGVAVAIEALSWMELKNLSERAAVRRTLEQFGLRDVLALRMGHMIVVETMRRLNALDEVAKSHLGEDSYNNLTLGVKNFIRIFIYWVIYRGAPFDEVVALTRCGREVLGWREMLPVEFTLGKILAARQEKPRIQQHEMKRVSLETFHPTWFVEYCYRVFGRQMALLLLKSGMSPPPTYLRVNTLRGTEEALVQEISAGGVQLLRVESIPNVYEVISSKRPLPLMRAYRDGLFYIQDASSCLSSLVADPQPDSTVLDVCAAPGAKTSHLAQLMKNRGTIYSVDKSARRMNVWVKEMKRMRVENANPIVSDATVTLPLDIEADTVALDAPCSGTGSFARTPSLKWKMTPTWIEKLTQMQWCMLEKCAERTKPNGTLVYSTCSVMVEENEMLIEQFLKVHPEFRLADQKPRIGLTGLRGMTKCQRLYSYIHRSNGFFVANLTREKA